MKAETLGPDASFRPALGLNWVPDKHRASIVGSWFLVLRSSYVLYASLRQVSGAEREAPCIAHEHQDLEKGTL